MQPYNTYKDVKICCYAMCADEPEQFIDRWLESMKGADFITVLVTKANNPNYTYFLEKQKLPEFKDKLIVEEKDIKPWRFDLARNESMKLIPEGTDACVCTDIDEVLIPDFWDDYRKCVFEHPNFERVFYQYAWSHDAEGNPKWYFWYDKTHQAKGWHWEYPVHETLTGDPSIEYSGSYYLDSNKIYLHHYPDDTKSRGSYLGLLELRAQEYPDDLYGLFYLAREYGYKGMYEHKLVTAMRLYTRLKKGDPTPEELAARDDMAMLSGVCQMLGECFAILGIKDEAEYYYKKGIAADPKPRDCYIGLAELYAYNGQSRDTYETLLDMERNSRYIPDWRMVSYYWKSWKTDQLIAVAKCYESKYLQAREILEKAIDSITVADDRADAQNEGLFRDYEWVCNYIAENHLG